MGRRSRAVSATELASRSYAQSVQEGSRAQTARVEASLLPTGGKAKECFTRFLIRQSSARRADRRSCNLVMPEPAKTRRPSSWKQFRRLNWREGIVAHSPEGKAEGERLSKMWKDMPDAEKAVYIGEATNAGLRRAQAADASRDDVQDAIERLESRGMRESARRSHNIRLFDALKNHPTWQIGAKLSGYGAAFRSELVGTQAIHAGISTRMALTFDYDPHEVENPESVRPEVECRLQCGGLCRNDTHLESANVVLYNLYVVLKRGGATKSSYPVFLVLRTAGNAELCVLVAFPYGKGEFFGVTQVRRLDTGLGYELAYADTLAGRLVVVSSLHVLVHRFLEEAQRANGGDPVDSIAYGVNKIHDLKKNDFAFSNELWLHGEMSAVVKEKAPKIPKDAVELPLGMSFVPKRARVKKEKTIDSDDEPENKDDTDDEAGLISSESDSEDGADGPKAKAKPKPKA